MTWGGSFIGYASWALAASGVPEWRLAIALDAPSEVRDAVYPGGAFAGALMLGWVHSIDWLARHRGAWLPRQLLASILGARRVGKVLAEPPLGTADRRLVGQHVDYYQQLLALAADELSASRRQYARPGPPGHRLARHGAARTGGSAEGYSIPAQRAACRTKATQLGAVIHEEYVDAGEQGHVKFALRGDVQRKVAKKRCDLL